MISLSLLFSQTNDSLTINTITRSMYFYVRSNMSRITREKVLIPERGVLVEELYYDSIFLGIDSVITVPDYQEYTYTTTLKNKLAQYTTAFLQQQAAIANQGLIPDIELPIRLPTALAGIIGQGGNLRINGRQRIEFGGSQSTDLNAVQTEYTQNDFLPELKMEQQLQVNLQGTIGQKISVFVDHNSEAQSELRNQIRLQYKGYEDEVIHLVEMGHTQLSLPGTELIGMPAIQMGLFGIKSEMQFAGLNVIAIATKEEGKSESRTFVGQATEDSVVLWDTDYIRRQYFWLGQYGSDSGNVNYYDTILGIKVWVDDNNAANNNQTGALYGYLHFYTQSDSALGDSVGWFDFKELNEFYSFDYKNNILELNYQLTSSYKLGVCYIVGRRNMENGPIVQTDTIGTWKSTYNQGDTVELKVINPQVERTYYPTWDLQLRNRYSLQSSAIVPGSFSMKIYKHITGSGEDQETQGDQTYIHLLGLDQNDDGIIDQGEGYINYEKGYLEFPNLFPFSDTVLDDPDSIIYDTTATDVGRKYKLVMKYKGIRSVFSLGALNILEGSEVVTVNGERMVRNVDYTIDYDIGVVTFITDKVNDPNAVVNIDFQYAPFISLADKSLLGVRMDYQISPALSIGGTAMYRSISTKEDHPHLGDEPRNITMATVDMNLSFRPEFMTKAVDILPLIDASAPSLLTIRGALATSRPNPNTKGFVYLDDMEGNKMTINLGVNRTNWHFGSIPDSLNRPELPDISDTTYLGQIYWYSPNDWWTKGDLNPDLPSTERDDNIQVMSVVMEQLDSGAATFVSLQQCLSNTGMDLSEFRFLEVWVYGDQGNVHIDLGYNIPEDIYRRTGVNNSIGGRIDTLDTEDLNRNGILETDEDRGLDNVWGEDALQVAGDEWNDDYPGNVQPSTYRQLKGTEGNDRLDTEDLNNDGILNVSKDYVEYSFSVGGNEFLEIDRGNGWRLYKIPLHDSLSSTYIGSPDWERVRYARLWIDSFTDQTDSLLFGEISLTGNRWRKNSIYSLDSVADSLPGEYFEVTTKNNYEDPDYYPPIDPGRDDLGNEKREGSLVLIAKNLNHNRVASCYYYTSVFENYNLYKEMKVWVHGNGEDGYLFLRIGGDTLTYYEYRMRIPNGWEQAVIDFDQFIDLKKTIEGDTTGFWNEGNYYIRTYNAGKPSLTKVNRLTLGLVDDVPNTQFDSIEIWVDELRLSSPYRETGLSGNITLNATFSDVMTLNATLNYTDANYQKITQEQGTGTNNINYTLNGTFQGGKFFPYRWGVIIPVTASYTNSRSVPKFYPGSDIRLDPEESEDQSTRSNTTSISASFSKGTPSLNRILALTVDNIRLTGNWTKTNTITYNRADTTITKSASFSWSYAPVLPTIKLLGQEIGTFPATLSVNSSYQANEIRSHLIPDTSENLITDYRSEVLTNTYVVGYNLLKPLTITYTFTRNRDLTLEDAGLLGTEILRNQRVSVRYTPVPVQFLRPTLSFETNYGEDSRPELKQITDTTDIRNVSNSNTIAFSATMNFTRPFEWIGRIRDESRDTSATPGSPQWILKNLGELGRKITPISFSVSRTRITRFYRLIFRPDLFYQLGLKEGIDPDQTGKYSSANDYKNVTYNVNGSSGFNLTYLTCGLNYSWSRSLGGNIGNKTYNMSLTWPRVTFSLQQLHKLLKLQSIQSTTISTGYAQTSTYTGPEGQEPTRIIKSIDLSPLISFQVRWNNGLNSNFTMSRTITDTDNKGAVTTLTRQESSNYSALLSYTFSAPGGIPLFGNTIKFNSLLTLSVSYRLNNTREYYRTSGENISLRSNYSITPSASYNFSQNITGGMNANYTLNEDRQTGRKIRNVGLSAWAEFRF